MKNKKVLLYYLLEFILTIAFFFSILIIIFKLTIFDKDYFVHYLNKNNYYNEVYKEINDDFDNYIMQSGFDNSIIKNLFSENDLKKVINNNVDNYYKGKDFQIDDSKIRDNLEKNINDYFKNINIEITDLESINQFQDEMVNIYINKIIIHKELMKTNKIFFKIMNLTNMFLIGLIFINIILYIVIKLWFKKITLTIPILTSCCILLILCFYIKNYIDINYLYIWNQCVSNIVKDIMNDILYKIKQVSVIGIGFGLLKTIICQFVKK